MDRLNKFFIASVVAVVFSAFALLVPIVLWLLIAFGLGCMVGGGLEFYKRAFSYVSAQLRKPETPKKGKKKPKKKVSAHAS